MTNEITRLLSAVRSGNHEAKEELFRVVYDELRNIARGYLARELPNHTLAPTALVNEAYLRLCHSEEDWSQNKAFFFAAFAITMHQLLLDWARKRHALRRGGNWGRVPLRSLADGDAGSFSEWLTLADALEALEEIDEPTFRVVKLRFFEGLSMAEIGEHLGIAERTVRRKWRFANAFLDKEMRKGLTSR